MKRKISLKFGILGTLIVLLIVSLDQLSKRIIIDTMEVGESKTVIENFFYITSHRNDGAAWSILEGKMGFFYGITIVALAIMVYFLITTCWKNRRIMLLGLLLAIGGTIGNFIDRIVHKEVVDFLDFILFDYDYPTFNIADIALVIGMLLIAVTLITSDNKSKKDLAKAEDEKGEF